MNEKYNKVLINIINNKMENLNTYKNRIYNIFNKCSEKVQIDFVKLLFILNKEKLNELIISNIVTIKELLNWGCINNNLQLIIYVLTHKDIKLDPDFYYSLEKLSKSRELVEFITHYRIKDTYEVDSDNNSCDNYSDSSDSSSSDSNSSDSSSIFSSDLDRTSENEEEDNYNDIKYGKHINPEDVEEVD
jgi:hypothetical protein